MKTYFYAGDTPSPKEIKRKKKILRRKKIRHKQRKKKIRKRKTAVQGATDVPNFPQDQVSEDWQRKSGKSKSGGLNEKGRKSYERQNLAAI